MNEQAASAFDVPAKPTQPFHTPVHNYKLITIILSLKRLLAIMRPGLRDVVCRVRTAAPGHA